METKPKRFSHEEKNLCFHLAQAHSNIIESAETDPASVKCKEDVWNQITFEFNTRNKVQRAKEALKRVYEVMKKELIMNSFKAASLTNEVSSSGYQTFYGGDKTTNSDMEKDIKLKKEEEFGKRRVIDLINNNNNPVVNLDKKFVKKGQISKVNEQKWLDRKRSAAGTVAKKYGALEIQVAREQLEQLKKEGKYRQQKHEIDMEEIRRKRMREDEEYQLKKKMDFEEFELRKRSLELDVRLKEAQLKALNLI